jgi:hypothetical protein
MKHKVEFEAYLKRMAMPLTEAEEKFLKEISK